MRMASFNPIPRTERNSGLPLSADSHAGSPRHSDYMNGKVIITAGVILAVVVFFILAFHVYVRLSDWLRHRRRPATSAEGMVSHASLPKVGLDKVVVNSLPTFLYSHRLLQEGADAVCLEAGTIGDQIECAVCLNEFQEHDACRLLPKCSHSFHTECIDKWFLCNTTCPLCRANA